MASLSLTFLGRFKALLDDQPLPGFRTSKVQALLTYLVVEPERHTRESLMNLLWPGMPERSARHNLRQVLYNLRNGIPALQAREQNPQQTVALLLANRQTIQLNPAADVMADVTQFVALLESTQSHEHLELLNCSTCRDAFEEAIDLYQGDFLADFYLDDSNEFEQWSQVNRQAYRRKALDALELLTAMAFRQKDYPQARAYAERQLDIDNLRESAYRQMMEILALSGQRSEAMVFYENCRRLLKEELGMQPAARTTEIYEMIQAGELSFDAPQAQGVRGYELKEKIGEGSYGTIHRAVQPVVGREVAIKVIRRAHANDPEFIRRFDAEAQTVARLEHPFIVPLYDYWRDPDGAYLVMRYLTGGSLLTALESGPWDLESTIQMLEQVASALTIAHQQGIIHRDIKPANILLDEAGNAYLSDFGIAKELGGNARFTSAGAIIGTPDYISPEQILNEQVGPQSDIYSLGAVLYETLTGEKPFGDSTVANLIYKHLNETIPRVSDSQPGLPATVDRVIQKATSKQPADRFAHPMEMVAALRAAFSDDPAAEVVAIPTGLEVYNPYKGLQAFQEADADDFFGRDSLVGRLTDRLAESGFRHEAASKEAIDQRGRFLALVGPSGSGKSSVVKAGLIPALRQGAVPGSERWFVAEMVPGTHPLEELEMALWSVAVDPPPSLVEPMQRDMRGMLRTLRRILPDAESGQLLLVIDQFEELFTLVEDEERRDFFIDSLLAAVSAPRSPLRVVITLRADFYDRPLQYQMLGQLLKENTEIVLPLTPEELTWAVREPARRVGVSLEDGLAESVVTDVADQPGGLPLLQYALTELFERRQANRMTRTAYEDIGGVLGALSHRADELYDGLEEPSQQAAQQVFLRLVTLGEGVEDTRRRVVRSELETIGNSQLPAVIDAFGRVRLLTFDHDPVTRQPTVEVAHEALLREWSRLRNWISESRDDVRLQRQLAQAAREWIDAGQDASYLLRGTRLAQFADWEISSNLALTRDESSFLEASVDFQETRHAEEETRRQRELETARQLAEAESKRAEEQASAARRLRQRAFMLAGVLAIAIVFAIAAALFGQESSQNADLAATREAEAVAAAEARATAAAEALNQKNIAEQERSLAQEQALVAQSRELAAASYLSQGADPELGLLLAMQALTTNETGEAEQALHSALLASRVRLRLVGHQEAIQRLAYSPDGKFIALAAFSEDLGTLWDAASGRKLHEFPVDRCCWGLYFDDEGRRLAAAEPGESFSLAILDVVTGEKQEGFPLPIPTSDVGGFYLNLDWTRAVFYLRDGSLAIWDLREGEKLFDLPGHAGADWVELEYSKDGRRLVTYDFPYGVVLVWDADTGELIRRLETESEVNDHAVSPDGRRVALAVSTETGWEVHIWDLATPVAEGEDAAPIARLTGHPSTIRLIDFSPDGSMIASASRDGTSRIWDSLTGALLHVLPHGSHVRSVVFHPDGGSLLSSDVNGVARVWDITPEGASERLGWVAHDSFRGDLSPDGKMYATGGVAKVWDLATGALVQQLDEPSGEVGSVAFHPDGRRLATANADGTASVWDIATGAELLTIDGHADTPWIGNFYGMLSVDYSPSGERLATAGADGTARIWDGESGEQLFVLEGHTAGVTSVTFSPDGRYLATGQDDGAEFATDEGETTVRIWDAETGESLLAFDAGHGGHGDTVWGLAFSPDGRFLATGAGHPTARLWSLDIDGGSAELVATLSGHKQGVVGVAFSPDGRTLATGTPEQVRLWDVTALYDGSDNISIPELLALPGGGFPAFSLDGTELITGGRDGLMRVYLLDPAELLSFAQTRLTRWWTEGECRRYLHSDTCPEE